jgi:hypothetical protein
MKRQTKRKSISRIANRVKGVDISNPEFLSPPAVPFSGVWSGRIARLRVYVSTRRVFAYKDPGTNADGVGSTDDPNTIHALFLARDNGRWISGYTDDSGSIGFIDY